MNRANRPRLSRISGSSYASKLLGRAGDGSTLTLDFTTGVLDPRLTFTRTSGGTYTGNDGLVYGMDFATSSSLAIGTGSKSVTLTATAGVDRRYLVGQTVYISNGANNMSGPVTAYNASTQVMTIDATGTSGSGSFTSWTVGNASARFDHDPTTLEPRGLLVEATATNLAPNSNLQANWLGGTNTTVTANTTEVTSPDGTNNAAKIALTSAVYCSRFESITGLANATTYTFSYWIRGTAGNQQRVYSATQGTDLVTQSNLTYTSTGWTRVQITFTSGAANNNVYIYVASRPTGTVNDVLYVWGCQLEVGNVASSLIPRAVPTNTRNVDTAIIAAGTNFTSWYQGGTQGTFYADWFGGQRLGASGSASRTILSTDDVSTRHLHLVQTAAAGNLRVADFGGTNNVTTSNTLTSGARTKGAFSYNGSTANVCLNGGTVATGSSLAFSATPTWLVIGGTSTNGTSITDGNVLLNNSIRTIKYWPIVLPNSTLQALTA